MSPTRVPFRGPVLWLTQAQAAQPPMPGLAVTSSQMLPLGTVAASPAVGLWACLFQQVPRGPSTQTPGTSLSLKVATQRPLATLCCPQLVGNHTAQMPPAPSICTLVPCAPLHLLVPKLSLKALTGVVLFQVWSAEGKGLSCTWGSGQSVRSGCL
jgi:hypothetical protein